MLLNGTDIVLNLQLTVKVFTNKITTMPSCFLLKAKRQMGKIPKGFMLQVTGGSISNPDSAAVKEALKRAGCTDSQSLSYSAAGNWEVKKL